MEVRSDFLGRWNYSIDWHGDQVGVHLYDLHKIVYLRVCISLLINVSLIKIAYLLEILVFLPLSVANFIEHFTS
jgi:hypothetical protein